MQKCHICGRKLDEEGAEDCPVMHEVEVPSFVQVIKDVRLKNGLIVPKGVKAEVLGDVSGGKVKIQYVDLSNDTRVASIKWERVRAWRNG